MRLAKAKGTQHALANAIAWAYFMDHRLINDDEVLADIAVRARLCPRARRCRQCATRMSSAITHDLAIAAAQQGIQGVPFFVFDNKFAVSGCQPDEVFARAFEYALDPAKLAAAALTLPCRVCRGMPDPQRRAYR